MTETDGRKRVIIEGVRPEVDGGAFPAKRAVGDIVEVEADIFADGHDEISAVLLHRRCDETSWREIAMKPLVNDRWRGLFRVEKLTPHIYTIEAWVDHFKTWHGQLKKRAEAKQELEVQFQIGAEMIAAAAERADDEERSRLFDYAERLRGDASEKEKLLFALDADLTMLMTRHPDRRLATRYAHELTLHVDRRRAAYSSWYELFPRSTSPKPGRHGTFRDVEARLPYVASMGFDVLYLPPIHPIGTAFRKGKNNATTVEPGEPGSPWAIGGPEGGHKSIHPELGTIDDFRSLVRAAEQHGIEIALDIAFQVSPDHPYVKEHPEWFLWRPDGTVQYAENPPKKYQDIYPFHFETEQWQSLWKELRDVFLYWAGEGVRIFRVDNPHTKPLPFWEWVIAQVRQQYPDAIFLAEAFTRPKIMYYLAKAGFTQSYTYFAWRTTKRELTEYFTELTQPPVVDFFRPNAWPNTPDILTEALQTGGRATFMTRLVLAATLSANYGIYGPAFELGEHEPREEGSEEYLNSEKYEIRTWNLDAPGSLREFIARVNLTRRTNPALQSNERLLFHETTSDQMLCYSKQSADRSNTVVMVVNLHPQLKQSAFLDLDLEQLGIDWGEEFQVHDQLTGARYAWRGARNYVELDPAIVPAHIFVVRRRVRAEQNFEYYL